MDDRKQKAQAWFKCLRDQICNEFENIEAKHGNGNKFKVEPWQRNGGGGGLMSIMKGEVFEKVGVNVSTVYGEFSPTMIKEIPGADVDPRFWASGISVVAHMKSPFIPAIHMNTRMIATSKTWFGGGIDLTPTFIDESDEKFFHHTLKDACDGFDPTIYDGFKKHCDEYFYLPHRKEKRGIGGIFYDYLSGDWDKDFELTKIVGNSFLKVFVPIIDRNITKPWNDEHKQAQLLKRGRYVEFNLLYDRGTKFGLMTDGNIDAIFMSLPPEVKWN